MGHLDTASVTDRPATTPPADLPEPRDRGWIVLLAIGVAAVAVAAFVLLSSGSDEPSRTAGATEARTPRATATATLAPLPAPANPTDPAAGSAENPGAPAPTAASPAPAGGAGSGLPAGWSARTFQGVTFAVPPGATAPDVIDPGNADAPALFSWNGPSLGSGVMSHVTMWVYAAGDAPELGPEYTATTVPGADRAHVWSGATGTEPPSTTVDLHIVDGGRYINLNATVAPGAAGEQMVRDLLASVVVG